MAFKEMADGTESKQKAEYVSHQLITKVAKNDYLELTYKRLDGPSPGQEAKAGTFVVNLSAETKAQINKKGEFVVVKTLEKGKYWPLTRVDDISTYVEKPVSTYTKSSYTGKASGSGTYNNAGIKVGACAHDACTLVGQGGTVAQVKKVVEELLYMSYELEQNVNDGKYVPKGSTTTAPTHTKSIESPSTQHDTLENIEL